MMCVKCGKPIDIYDIAIYAPDAFAHKHCPVVPDAGVRSNDLIAGREPREQDGGAEGNQEVMSEATTRAIAATGEHVDLLPCPFCGGEAQFGNVEGGFNDGGQYISCMACDVSTRLYFPLKEDVRVTLIHDWNRRAWHP